MNPSTASNFFPTHRHHNQRDNKGALLVLSTPPPLSRALRTRDSLSHHYRQWMHRAHPLPRSFRSVCPSGGLSLAFGWGRGGGEERERERVGRLNEVPSVRLQTKSGAHRLTGNPSDPMYSPCTLLLQLAVTADSGELETKVFAL